MLQTEIYTLTIGLILLALFSMFWLRSRRLQNNINGIKVVYSPYYHLQIQNMAICRQIYSKSTALPKNLGLGTIFEIWLGQCLGHIELTHPAWGALKRIYKPLFDYNRTGEFVELFDLHLRDLYYKSKNECRSTSIKSIINNLPLEYMTKFIFGNKYYGDYKRIFDILEKCAKKLMFHIVKDNKQTTNHINNILRKFQYLWKMIMSQAELRGEGIYHILYDSFINENKRLGDKLTFQMFSQTLIEILYANQDVLVPSLSRLLIDCAIHNDLFLKSDPRHFIEESARLSPLTKTSLPKITASNIKIDENNIISKGTAVCIDFENIGKSSEFKMNDLDRFNPDRYKNIEIQNFVNRFGYGGRKCPGNKLANLLFAEIIKYLRENWRFIPVNKNDPIIDKESAFDAPDMNVWITPIDFPISPGKIYYDYPPHIEETENGFLAVSVNENSPFLSDNEKVKSLVNHFTNTNNDFMILICDGIAHYNIQAFSHKNEIASMEAAKKLGDKFEDIFRIVISSCDKNKIKLCRWNELKILNISCELSHFPNLAKRVNIIAENFLNHRGQGKTNTSYNKKISLISNYIYSEIPVLICGIYYDNKWYRSLYYSGHVSHLEKFTKDKTSLHNLILDIHNKSEFLDVRRKIFELMGTDRCKINGFIGLDIDMIANDSKRN